jgi:hypothetical protein
LQYSFSDRQAAGGERKKQKLIFYARTVCFTALC